MMRHIRRGLWLLGAPFRWILLGVIKVYQVTLSGWLGGQCKFYPTCSHYAQDAIRVHGALKGSLMAAWRIARCGPFTDGGVDHVPPRGPSGAGVYDSIIRREAA